MREYVFDKRQVDGFRYRMEDALRAVTRYTVQEARVKEIKQELLASDKLKVGVLCHEAPPLPLRCARTTCSDSARLCCACVNVRR